MPFREAFLIFWPMLRFAFAIDFTYHCLQAFFLSNIDTHFCRFGVFAVYFALGSFARPFWLSVSSACAPVTGAIEFRIASIDKSVPHGMYCCRSIIIIVGHQWEGSILS